jgi:predicted SprT family Zn-dependent metalloprotease
MLSIDAEKLAKQLIQQYCPGYVFQWDRSKRRFGACYRGKSTISLSLDLTIRNSEEQVRDTILHEIAHALTPGHHHDYTWKMACIRIGAKPERCYNSTVIKADHVYEAKCHCMVHKAFRRIRRNLICKHCRVPLVFQQV